MRAVLFVGPSIEPEMVRAAFPGEIRPPIKRGDLDAVLGEEESPEHVGIVDGQFLQALAISPKEVLRALDRGVRVYGSSSMGALRAAECAPFGMIGIGRIFQMYERGDLDADDEVALTFDTDALRALSEPMVNIRIALQAAVDTDVISPETGEQVTAAAKAMYFPERSYGNLLRVVRDDLDDAEYADLTRFLRSGNAPDQKRTDALALIEAICRARDSAVRNDDDAAPGR